MKLSHTMLNFLGYIHANQDGYCSKDEPKAFLTHLGAIAALKNGLLVVGTLELEGVNDPVANALGLGLKCTLHGYRLTELGREVGEIGARMRRDRTACRGTVKAGEYISEGQRVIAARTHARTIKP
jgi:hypothetical protein